jgi:hypothetical protein
VIWHNIGAPGVIEMLQPVGPVSVRIYDRGHSRTIQGFRREQSEPRNHHIHGSPEKEKQEQRESQLFLSFPDLQFLKSGERGIVARYKCMFGKANSGLVVDVYG